MALATSNGVNPMSRRSRALMPHRVESSRRARQKRMSRKGPADAQSGALLARPRMVKGRPVLGRLNDVAILIGMTGLLCTSAPKNGVAGMRVNLGAAPGEVRMGGRTDDEIAAKFL